MDSRGAGCGRLSSIWDGMASMVVLRLNGIGSTVLILRNLLMLKISLSLRKSGSSKFIFVPRWSSRRERCARFKPSSRSDKSYEIETSVFFLLSTLVSLTVIF